VARRLARRRRCSQWDRSTILELDGRGAEGDDAAGRERDGVVLNDLWFMLTRGDLLVDLPGGDDVHFRCRVRYKLSMIAHTFSDPCPQPHALRGVRLPRDVLG